MKKNIFAKKSISVLLALIMLFSVFQITFSASAEDNRTPIIFVTGIGQTFSHIKAESDEEADYFYPYKATSGGEIEYIPCKYGQNDSVKGKNLFIVDFGTTLKNIGKSPVKLFNSICGILQLFASIFTGDYLVSDENLATIFREVLCLMTLETDEDGNKALPEEVFVPFYNYPVSEYVNYPKPKKDENGQIVYENGQIVYVKNEYTIETVNDESIGKNVFKDGEKSGKVVSQSPKERFEAILGGETGFEQVKNYGEDKIYCFNYAPYGSIEKLTEDLKAYIDDVSDDGKVILVPMSMGATLVSNYLYNYGDEGKVEKVISVVGCWQGSDLFADLVEGKYAENSPEIFYREMIPELLKGEGLSEGVGPLLSILVHCLSKDTLTPLCKNLVNVIRDEFILKTPTMLALIPPGRYQNIRDVDEYYADHKDVFDEVDKYYEAQKNIKEKLKKLNDEQYVEFYFIAGYNLGFGDVSHPYFKCFESSPTTNSDEIIQIESTTIGATSLTPGTEFSQEYIDKAKEENEDKYISPDKSVDLSTAVFRDNCFLFYGQKHELEHNITAITLAVKLALGENKTSETFYKEYPQFSDKIDNNLKEPEDWDYYVSFITKPLYEILYHFTGAQGIPDLFK